VQYIKILTIILLICIIVGSMFVFTGCDKDKEGADFSMEAIKKFQDNENLFEQVKENILKNIPDNITFVTLYVDKSNHVIAKNGASVYNDLSFDESFKESLLRLSAELKPMSMDIDYDIYDAEGMENKTIKFHLSTGSIRGKGIVYITNNDGEDLKEKLRGLSVLSHIKGNWYYYEELGGV